MLAVLNDQMLSVYLRETPAVEVLTSETLKNILNNVHKPFEIAVIADISVPLAAQEEPEGYNLSSCFSEKLRDEGAGATSLRFPVSQQRIADTMQTSSQSVLSQSQL